MLAIILLSMLAAVTAHSQASPPEAEAVLGSALQDECHAEAFYAAVIAKFGAARPFSNIINSERQHESLLIGLYEAFGAAVPENGHANGTIERPEVPRTLIEACKSGAEAEIANRDLYDRQLLPAVASYPDIAVVVPRLRDASENNRLPAFQRCASRS